MLGRCSFLGAAGPLLLLLALLLALTSTAQAKSYNQTAKDIQRAKKAATKNGCILGFYAKGQKPWPSSRRNRPISMFTIIKNRGSTPYEQVYLRFYKNPEVTLLPTIYSKPEQNLALLPSGDILPPPFYDPIHYFGLGPMTIRPGTQKIRWRFKLPNCAGPQKFNVTVIPIPNPQIPITCWTKEFRVRLCLCLCTHYVSASCCAEFYICMLLCFSPCWLQLSRVACVPACLCPCARVPVSLCCLCRANRPPAFTIRFTDLGAPISTHTHTYPHR